jgi:hydrogenase nickel incorporation protein HypB
VPEGDDKPAKYPAIFAKSKALLINKIDLLGAGVQIDFDIEKVKADASRLNKTIKIFPISAKTGRGMDAWCQWLAESAVVLRSRDL